MMEQKRGNPGERNVLPTITLPKGGGSLQGCGEKFSANPATGTGSMVVPLVTSAGRMGFGPSLSLAYGSSVGNGPFGFGWALSLPSITRKTSRGIPRYCDAEESDVFVLSDSEDLVPFLDANGARFEDVTTLPGYTIHRYRPRIEGGFSRIQRCTSRTEPGDVHWRVYSSDNVLSIYGINYDSRIHNPEDKTQIFSWLLAETRDFKGNAILYGYIRDNAAGLDLSKPHQRNRGTTGDPRRSSSRYLKSVRYGNTKPLLDADGNRPHLLPSELVKSTKWLFELVLDYGEHDLLNPLPTDAGSWVYRADPFSTYRAGFEVRTTRLCRRFLMFHHFELEEDVGTDCLVSCTTLSHESYGSPYSFLRRATRSGFKRNPRDRSRYIRLDQPPVDFEYSLPSIQEALKTLDAASLENLPAGLATPGTRWIDLYGEGISGVMTESPGAWHYKRNLTPINPSVDMETGIPNALFGPTECVSETPNTNPFGIAQLLELRGDGRIVNVVDADHPLGFYAADGKDGWLAFEPFSSTMNCSTHSPTIRYLDLDGDGIADALIEDESVLVWHPSLENGGFGGPLPISSAIDEELAPRQLLSNAEESIYFSDMTGDGLSDVVRIRNGEVCYWPNLGYGRFGAKIEMDDAPLFDYDEQFSHQRVILADVDGTGTADIIYLHSNGARVYLNHCGNAYGPPRTLSAFASPVRTANITAIDLLGNGTQCLVMSTPGCSLGPAVQYLSLVGPSKPFLLTRVTNNVGATTSITYAPSTKFYLAAARAGRPWISRLPFPVQVVESVQTQDDVSRSIFKTRYAYHHGFYDLEEREFRGFGMVEQWDSEAISSVSMTGPLPPSNNLAPEHMLPPVRTKSWFHTGLSVDGANLAFLYRPEYYSDAATASYAPSGALLPDSEIPPGLSAEERREAVRALKGGLLRQEIYSEDANAASPAASVARAKRPHAITETNFAVTLVQPRGGNLFCVFQPQKSEEVTLHTERNAADPRIQHSMVLETNSYGHVLKEVAIAYGRLVRDAELPTDWDRDVQSQTIATYTEQQKTNDVDDTVRWPFSYQLPATWESRSFELTGFGLTAANGLSPISSWTRDGFTRLRSAETLGFEQRANGARPQKRLLSCTRTLFCKDDLTGLLPAGRLDGLALGGETYTLALTDSIVAGSLTRNGQPLLDDFAAALTSVGPSGGGYMSSGRLKAERMFPASDPDGQYWIPSGRSFFDSKAGGNEAAIARAHFFIPRRHRNPFGAEGLIAFDKYDLLPVDARDFVGCRISVGERDAGGNILRAGVDYRLIHPRIMTDANGNRTEVAFDALGRVVGSAVRGKVGEDIGDKLVGFDEDLDDSTVVAHMATPLANAADLLGTATTRHMYDVFAYMRTSSSEHPEPCRSYSMTRVTHVSDLAAGKTTEILHSFTYADGLGRAVQTKSLVNAGPVPQRDNAGSILLDADQQPVLTPHDVSPRWAASAWIIYNNKGLPVRRFEPFFTDRHAFEFDVRIGVSGVVFYDAPGRVLATLLPEGIYSKVLLSPWKTVTWDENDTVLDDPGADPDIQQYVKPYIDSLPLGWQTWHTQRVDRSRGAEEKEAADKAAAHARTPSVAHLDSLGRAFLAVEQSKVNCPGHPLHGTDEKLYSRSELDISGLALVARDSIITPANGRGRIVSKITVDMLGKPLYKNGLENGESWSLSNIYGKIIYAWNNDSVRISSQFDRAGRPTRTLVLGDAMSAGGATRETVLTRTIYGDNHWEAAQRNLVGEVYATADQAGFATTERLDFKGMPLEKTHRVAAEYKLSVDWSPLEQVIPAAPQQAIDRAALESALAGFLLPEGFTSTSRFDAMGRLLSLDTPHTPAIQPSTIRLEYDVQMLARIDLNLQHEVNASGLPVWTPFIKVLKLNAKGQKLSTTFGNDVVSTNEFNAVNQLTGRFLRRDASRLDADLMNLHFTYDAAGNVTNLRDDAKQTYYFAGDVVTPTNSYVYDSNYRLIQAIGREHVGQTGGAPTAYGAFDTSRFGPHPGQAEAMAGYTEQYVYDSASNIKQMRHIGSRGGWTRNFSYEERGSVVGEDDVSNKLSFATTGNVTERFSYDRLGNTTHFPHLGGTAGEQNAKWDFLGQLRELDLGGGGRAYYTYNAAGNRVRKVIERNPVLSEERLYLGEVELFRKKRSGDIFFERESLHLNDDKRRIALVETRTRDDDGTDRSPRRLIRYQFSGHLGSSVLELDDRAQILSFEEYTPYGSTTYQATDANLETPKRYRFTGKERDEESGLEYHGVRYLAPWLGRWISPDPGGAAADGLNLYSYAGANPVRFTDPTGLAGEDEINGPYFGPTTVERGVIDKFGDEHEKITIQENDAPGSTSYGGTKKDPIPVPEKFRVARAISAANKTFMLKVQNALLGPSVQFEHTAQRPPVSLETHPELLFTRTFAELDEMALITKAAVDEVGPRGSLSLKDYKNAVNTRIWQIIKYGLGERGGKEAYVNEVNKAAAIVRKAFEFNRAPIVEGGQTKLVGRSGPPPEAGGGTPSPAAPAEPTAPAAPSPEATATPPSSKPAVEALEPVRPSASITEPMPESPGIGSVVGKSIAVAQAAAQIGNAVDQFQQGHTAAGVTTLGVTGLTLAVTTKWPIVGEIIFPVAIIHTKVTQPEVEDRAAGMYRDMLDSGHSELAARGVFSAVSTADILKATVWDSTISGLQKGRAAIGKMLQ